MKIVELYTIQFIFQLFERLRSMFYPLFQMVKRIEKHLPVWVHHQPYGQLTSSGKCSERTISGSIRHASGVMPDPAYGFKSDFQADEHLNRYDELKREIEMRDLLIQIVNHDITGSLRFATMLLDEIPSHLSDSENRLVSLKRSLNLLYHNSLEILFWTKTCAGSYKMDCKTLIVNPVLEKLMEKYRGLFPQVNILTQGTERRMDMNYDPLIFEACLGNLIENACKYSLDNRVEMFIPDSGAKRIVLANKVKDFSGDILRKMNHNNYSCERSKVKGLGLALSAHLLSKMGWKIRISLKGNKVYFVLYAPTN